MANKTKNKNNDPNKAKSSEETSSAWFGEEPDAHALRCPSCNTTYVEHLGLHGTCQELQQWKRTSEQLWDITKQIKLFTAWKNRSDRDALILEQIERLQGLDFYANGLERYAREVAPGVVLEAEEEGSWKRTAEVLWDSLLRIEGLCGTHRKNPEVFLDRVDAEIMGICKSSLGDVRKLASLDTHPDSDDLRDCSDEQLQRYLNRYVNVDLTDFHFCWPDLLDLYGIAVVPQSRDGGFDWLATDIDVVRYAGDITLETREGTEFSDPRIERAVTCCAILSAILRLSR